MTRNLKIQKAGESAITDIQYPIEYEGLTLQEFAFSVLTSNNAKWADDKRYESKTSGPGLLIGLIWPVYSDDYDEKLRQRYAEEHKKFKKLECYDLFEHRRCKSEKNKYYVDEYMIDFGDDTNGAAHLISDILRNVYGVEDDSQISFCTANCYDIDKHRKELVKSATEEYLKTRPWHERYKDVIEGFVIAIIIYIFCRIVL